MRAVQFRKLCVGITILALALTACSQAPASPSSSAPASSGTSASAGKTVVLRVGHPNTPDSPVGQTVSHFADLVKSSTNGAVTVQVFPSSQLGSLTNMIDSVRQGTLDMVAVGTDVMGNYSPSMNITVLPYLFQNWQQAEALVYGPVGQKITDAALQKTGIHTLGFIPYGLAQVYTVGVPVNSMADFSKLKIRVPQAPIIINTFKAYGAAPSVVDLSELYTALQNHSVNAFAQPIWSDVTAKFYEVTDSVVMTKHQYNISGVFMSDSAYKSLTPDQQQLVTKAAVQAGRDGDKLTTDEDTKDLAFLKQKGQKVYEFDTAPLKAAMKPIWADTVQQAGFDSSVLDQLVQLAGR